MPSQTPTKRELREQRRAERIAAAVSSSSGNKSAAPPPLLIANVGVPFTPRRFASASARLTHACAAGVPLEQVGRLRGQAPIKPLPIAVREEKAA